MTSKIYVIKRGLKKRYLISYPSTSHDGGLNRTINGFIGFRFIDLLNRVLELRVFIWIITCCAWIVVSDGYQQQSSCFHAGNQLWDLILWFGKEWDRREEQDEDRRREISKCKVRISPSRGSALSSSLPSLAPIQDSQEVMHRPWYQVSCYSSRTARLLKHFFSLDQVRFYRKELECFLQW